MKTNDLWCCRIAYNSIYSILLLLIAMVFETSCSKDDDSPEPVVDSSGRRLVSKLESTSDDGNYKLSFFYDKEGKIEKTVGDNPNVLKEATYVRTGDKLVIHSDYGEEGNNTYIFTLNEEGYISSYSNTIDYKYQNGGLSEALYRNNLSPDKFEWSNGDITTWRNGTQVVTCTYYGQTNKMNYEPYDVGGVAESLYFGDPVLLMTTGYFGRRNAHLLKEVQAANWHTEFSYEFDSEGYVTQMVMVDYDRQSGEAFTSIAKVTYIK